MTAQATDTGLRPDSAGGEQPSAGRVRALLSSLALRQETGIILVIVVIGIAAGIKNPTFLETSNLAEVLRASVLVFVMGAGTALLIIGGGLDLSVGAVFTLAALAACKLMVADVPVALAILGGLAVGAAAGAVNHLIITYIHVPPIIATLGTYFMILGLNIQLSGGDDILPLPDSFVRLGQGSFLGMSNVIWYAVLIGLVFWFLLEWTPFGVNVRALGGNRQAAVGVGLRVVRLDLILYGLASTTAALAGMIYAARVGAGQVSAGGTGLTLQVIAAVLIGGVSLFGGLGSITGVAVGAILLAEIDNALILTQVPPQYNNLVVGAVLIAAVGLDHVRRQRLYRKR
jgi:ribose transport system permease protein